MENVEPNQNQVAAASDQPQPAVFKLDTDCWDEVLDFLSLEDVHSFGQTCKAFQRVTGQYFQWIYQVIEAECEDDCIYIGDEQMNGFKEFVPKIFFDEDTDDSMLRYVQSNCKAVKEMIVSGIDFSTLDNKLIENVFRKLETLEILECKFDRDIFGALIESCVNLKRLTFFGCWESLPIRKHPTLQHLDLDFTALENDELKVFLELSPNVRSLKITLFALWENQDSIINTNLELDDLAIVLFCGQDEDVHDISLLYDLHQRGFYKRLHLIIAWESFDQLPDRLLALPGLNTLYTLYKKIIAYPVLTNVKELGIYLDAPAIDDMNAWASRFINIEHLFIGRPNSNAILLFIGRSVKLRSIKIHQFQGNSVDISTLNKERKKLKGARKVTIYVDENVYLATKWATRGAIFDMIELKRSASYNNIGSFALSDYFQRQVQCM